MSKVITVSEKQFENLTMGNLKIAVKSYYITHHNGRVVVNIQTGVSIILGSTGLKHTIYARSAGYIKLKAVVAIPELLKHAQYCNFKKASPDEIKNKIIGFLNFKSVAVIEGKKQNIKLVVRLTSNGKFYYDLSFKAKK